MPGRHRRITATKIRRVVRMAGLMAGNTALALALAFPAGAVANGTPAPAGRYDFAVKLTMTDIPRPDGSRYNSACSGALIAPDWILTAGHCFHDADRRPVSGPVPYQTTATIGRTNDTDATGHVIPVIANYQAPTGDVALAKLASPVHDVAPVLLRPAPPREGEILRIAGWGSRGEATPAPATHLQTGQMRVTKVTDTTVLVVGHAPQSTTSACVYDSGAPYLVEPPIGPALLVAVESGGPTCPHATEETTSRVDNQLPWILATMASGSSGWSPSRNPPASDPGCR